MIFFSTNIKYNFCVENILENKQAFQYKFCYKKKYNFLNLKHSPSQSLTNRLMKSGNFLKIYKLLKKFYYLYTLRNKFKSIPLMSNFLFFFNKYQSFRDFDRVLLWKYNSLDCMFTAKTRKIKKKKKKFNLNLLFITGLKRTLLCINIIKYIILMNLRRRKKNLSYTYLQPLFNYLMHDKVNSVIKIKYKIYKHKLMQLQS